MILRRFLHEIPPKISLQNTCISAWLTPQRGHLRGVKISDAASWSHFPNYKQPINNATHTIYVTDNYKLDFGSVDGNNWSDDAAKNESNKASHDAQNFSKISDTNHNPPPPQHNTGHIKTGKPHPSYT